MLMCVENVILSLDLVLHDRNSNTRFSRGRKFDSDSTTYQNGAKTMICYFRHMKLIFEQIGIEITPENKREIDKKIHALLGTERSW
jgi:hypothetical protein